MQQVLEAPFLGGFDGVEDVFRALLRHAFLAQEVFHREAVEVRDALDFSGFQEACDKARTEVFDVHRLAAHEMFE